MNDKHVMREVEKLRALPAGTPYRVDWYRQGDWVGSEDVMNERIHIQLLKELLYQFTEWHLSPQCLFECNGVDYDTYFVVLNDAIRAYLSDLGVFTAEFIALSDELNISFAREPRTRYMGD